MQIDEIPTGRVYEPIVVELEEPLDQGSSHVDVEFPRIGHGGRLLLVVNGRPFTVRHLGKHANEMRRLAATGVPTICVAQPVDEYKVIVDVRSFDTFVDLGHLQVEIPDEIADRLSNHLGARVVTPEILESEFLLVSGRGQRAFLGVAPGQEQLVDLVGRSCRLTLSTVDRVFAQTMVPTAHAVGREGQHLAGGTFKLMVTGGAHSVILSTVAGSTAPLFSLWEKYSEFELSQAKREAETIGTARHGTTRDVDDFLIELPIRANEDVQFLESLQQHIGVEIEVVPKDANFDNHRSLERFVGQLHDVNVHERTITLRRRPETAGVLSNDGVVRLCVAGASMQAERRAKVYDKLRTGNIGIPVIAELLREKTPTLVSRRKRNIPVTDAVAAVIPGEITTAQRRAIDIAINTPDIAIIQGPPGTGKSQVIAAIQQRLAEVSTAGSSRIILLTSVQHDAVDLVTSRTSIFGLPARRIAQRNRDVEDPIARWRRERVEALRKYHQTQDKSKLMRWLSDLILAYDETPYSKPEVAVLLERVADRCASEITDTLRGQLDRHASTLRSRVNRSRIDSDLRIVRGLRSNVIAHTDDGPEQAMRFLRRPPRSVPDWHARFGELITRVSEGKEVDLAEIDRVRSTLLDDILRTESIGGANLPDMQTRSLLAESLAELSRDKNWIMTPDEAIDIYLRDLELFEDTADAAIASYTAVWASTCQGAASMLKDFRSTDPVAMFPTVIIDEAARANPLDLLIPLVQASERVILVGDHRQLPQLVDDAVRDQVATQMSDHHAELLDVCLFERLFRHLEHLEIETGIPRTVTLNRQFRMHPMLGDFVSRVFYEPYGESFESGRPESEFEHGLPDFEGQCAVWVDVPRQSGRARQVPKQGWLRTAEAEQVAKLVSEILSSNRDLSVGVITFYAMQAQEILQSLVPYEITEVTEGNKLGIAERWRSITNRGKREERLRVGTVDSFQGKEFDVVVLSLVRSSQPRPNDTAIEVFGFLTSESRMCVALSRQRCLLIVVGDRSMAGVPQADGVRGLVELAEFCGARV